MTTEQRIPQGTILHTDNGDPLKVLRLLGAGGQGEVYEVDQEGTRYALKWYYPAPRDAASQTHMREQRNALRDYILPKSPPDARFVWPLAFVDSDTKTAAAGGAAPFGYLMNIWKPGFETLERLVCGRVGANDRVLATAAIGIVDAFRKLHLSGSVYKDINLGGFAFDPKTGDVLVVDNDNVRTNGSPGAILFPGFGAPEVVTGKSPCTTASDDHSLAVLLFYMFVRGNPLEGARELEDCYDMSTTRKLFGEEALFVFDAQNASNRPVPGVHDSVIRNWEALPGVLKAAFVRAFGEGLHDPSKRLTDGEWVKALSSFRDSLFECGYCKRETAYDREMLKQATQLQCVWCKKPIAAPARMKLTSNHGGAPLAIVMLSPRAMLYPHHLGETSDFSHASAELTPHPSKPNVWGLKNLTKTAWSYSVGDGTTHTVEPGQSAPIKDGLKLQFGRVQADVKA